nr:hypothetical protein L203_04366 [Cryptococcus depauperatus CBS 7841]
MLIKSNIAFLIHLLTLGNWAVAAGTNEVAILDSQVIKPKDLVTLISSCFLNLSLHFYSVSGTTDQPAFKFSRFEEDLKDGRGVEKFSLNENKTTVWCVYQNQKEEVENVGVDVAKQLGSDRYITIVQSNKAYTELGSRTNGGLDGRLGRTK